MKPDFSLIHSFAHQDTYIVMDINSGVIHSLSPEAFEFLQAWELSGGDAEKAIAGLEGRCRREELWEIYRQIKKLWEEGMLFSTDEELESYRLPEDTVIKALCLHVAHDCNLRCQYCFAQTGDFGGERGLMDLRTGKRALDFLFSAAGSKKHVEVDFFGGEPLLNFGVVKELILYGKGKAASLGKELKQTLTTNAVLLDKEKCEFLKREGIYLILSLDGRPEVQNRMRPFSGQRDSYPEVCRGIKEYIQNWQADTCYVRGTYTRYNLDFCEDVLHLAKQGFWRMSLEPVVASPDKEYALRKEDLPLLAKEYQKLADICFDFYREKKPFTFFHFNINLDKGPCLPKRLTGCGAGHEYLACSPAGDLYPCHQFVGQEEFKLGNVWEGIKNLDWGRKFRSAHVMNKEPCRKCWARFLCSGGCHANAYSFNGDIFAPYSIGCDVQRIRLECALSLQVRIWEHESEKTQDD